MIKITPCTPPPFNAAGIEVKALYFSQSPGEKFISVYARYREGQSWAPLYIGLPSIPTLQQVRDLDRNISLDSGSYNNAHIYLRSAAGNNMTTALYTNEEGGGIQVGNVDGMSALNLQPDGGLLTYRGNEVATRDWVSNQGYLTTNATNGFIKTGANYTPNMMTVIQNSILYHYGTEPDNPAGGSTGYSINSAIDGTSSIQLFLATGPTTGYNPDGFFWRGNNVGGPGWPGPWRQVASREWVQANFLSLANVINAQYASAQNANFWISGSARAQHFVANSLGYAITAHSGYYGFFTNTGSSTALPIKAKELVLSDSYADVAPVNGLFVKGNTLLKALAGTVKRKVVVNASGVLETAPLHGSGSAQTTIGTLATGIDIDMVGSCDESCGRLIITNTTVADISNVQIFVEYGTPYENEAKATFSPSNEAAATTNKVYLMNNDRNGFTLFIPLINKTMVISYDYNVVGY
jgi:hypothetical protein